MEDTCIHQLECGSDPGGCTEKCIARVRTRALIGGSPSVLSGPELREKLSACTGRGPVGECKLSLELCPAFEAGWCGAPR